MPEYSIVSYGESDCPSCGTPYIRHRGLHGTCKRVQDAAELLKAVLDDQGCSLGLCCKIDDWLKEIKAVK